MEVNLSILILSVPQRVDFLHRMLKILAPQVTKDVEVLIDMDNRASTLGAKRNALISRARGAYVVFVDDDDRVSDDYVAQLMVGIDRGVDAVGIQQVITFDGKNPQNVYERANVPWLTLPNGDYQRSIQHLSAVKRSIAVQIPYPETNFGEDKCWSDALAASGLIKTAHEIHQPVYFYESRTEKREFLSHHPVA